MPLIDSSIHLSIARFDFESQFAPDVRSYFFPRNSKRFQEEKICAIYAVDIMECDEDGLYFLTARGKSLYRKKLWSEDENTNGFTFDEFVNVKNPAENAFNEFAEEKIPQTSLFYFSIACGELPKRSWN